MNRIIYKSVNIETTNKSHLLSFSSIDVCYIFKINYHYLILEAPIQSILNLLYSCTVLQLITKVEHRGIKNAYIHTSIPD